MASPTSESITVSVPPEAGYVHILRAVTASVAARLPISIDGVEDLRLAVDEACAWLLARGRSESGMTLRLRPLDDRLEAEVSIDAVDGPWPPPDLQQSLPWKILSALVDTLSVDTDVGSPSIRLTKRTLEPSRTT
jgi:serine/threonine-protein kinase RsbW